MIGHSDMVAYYDYRLVVLSILISILGAYAERGLTERVGVARGRAWLAWLGLGATVDGIGTWSMHYTGMLSLSLPVPVLYDWPTVLLSLVIGIIGSAGALIVMSRSEEGWPRALAASIFLGGVGISGLHYTSMNAMRFQGMHYHDPLLATLAVILAIAISLMSLSLTFLYRNDGPVRILRNHGSALLRGSANPVMHYTAMAAVTFMYSSQVPDLSHVVSIASLGILGISIVPVMVLIVGLLTSVVDRLQTQRALLQATTEQLRSLSNQLIAAQEAERRAIARELHDEIGQVLTAVTANLQTIQLSPEASTLAERIEESLSLVDNALRQMRDLALDLRPSMLDDFGLVSALEWYFERLAERSGFDAEFIAAPTPLSLPPSLETTVFRVAQIALTNVARHAKAKHVRVELQQSETELVLIIQDDGVGFDVPAALERAARGVTLGLLSMQERVRLAQGKLEIKSIPEQGTEIRARFPITERG